MEYMEYEALTKKLITLLKNSGLVYGDLKVDGWGSYKDKGYIKVKFDCRTYNNFVTTFEKKFDDNEFKKFIEEIELVNSINFMKFNYVKITPGILRSSLDFYLDDKKISSNDLKTLFSKDLAIYKNILSTKIFDLEKN